MKQFDRKLILDVCILLILIPLVIGMGVWLFADRNYTVISIAVALLSCVPFFLRFERGKSGAKELTVIAVMTAFSVLGRIIFGFVPAFKPITAITIIAGIALGPEAGFLVGSLSAILSNIFFGQGPWTPFQMLTWGIIGFLAGILFFRRGKPNLILLSAVGLFGGVLFSLSMDIWTTVAFDGVFRMKQYFTYVAASLPFMAMYAVSNLVFLLILTIPFVETLNRIKTKYGIFGG